MNRSSVEGEVAPELAEDTIERRRHYLHPGQLHVSPVPCRISTILGSCVAVCLWAPRLGVGGMNHFVLPLGRGGREAPGRFGSSAVPRLIEELRRLGVLPGELRAKVFGGACVLDAFRAKEDHIGVQNIEVALDLLAREGILVVERDVGGAWGRKVLFDTDVGHAWVRRL